MKIKLYNILLLLLLTISCGPKNNNSIENNADKSVFKEVSRIKSKFGKIGNSYQYLYRGDYENLSSNIFEETLINMRVEFLLDNGNVITLNDYSNGGILSGGHPVLIKAWKSKETLLIGDKTRDEFYGDAIKSDYIPMHFKDYPIKQVTAVFNFDITDIVNQTKDTYENRIDITKEWNELK